MIICLNSMGAKGAARLRLSVGCPTGVSEVHHVCRHTFVYNCCVYATCVYDCLSSCLCMIVVSCCVICVCLFMFCICACVLVLFYHVCRHACSGSSGGARNIAGAQR